MARYMKKEWRIIPSDQQTVQSLIASLNCHPVTATVLANRSICSKQAALRFFSPSLSHIRPPFVLKDMDSATNRLIIAIQKHEKILIFGDYDVDGITAAAVLFEFLRNVGADVSYHLPHRINEGYGLKKHHISQLALKKNIDLIVTVDCGSDSHDAVSAANAAGVDIIITDHHNISENIPPAVAVVNPKRHDCDGGLEHLAGVGVVFYLLISLRTRLREIHFFKDKPEPNLKRYCDLVAIGTVADLAPIIAENRILTQTGLNIMGSNGRTGLDALVNICGIKNGYIGSEDISFRLAPRLNAAGRIDDPTSAFNLLTTDQSKTADQISQILNQLNTQRQAIEKQIFEETLVIIRNNPNLLQQKSLILSHKKWHEGVLGIVASKLVKKYHKPVILLQMRDGVLTGSARSIPGFNLYEGLSRCSELLEGFGGHAMAAGLSIKPEMISDFQTKFEESVNHLTPPTSFNPLILIDCEVPFPLITNKLLDELEKLKPFGAENPEPIFLAKNIEVVHSRIVGDVHRRMALKQHDDPTRTTINAIQFNIDPKMPQKNEFEQIAFRLQWNRWNGEKTAQIVIEEI